MRANIKRNHDEDLEERLQHGTVRPHQSTIAESTVYSYESVNSATQQLAGQGYDLSQQLREMRAAATTSRDTSRIGPCFNCTEMGHISRDCPRPRKQVERYGNRQQQQQQGRLREGLPGYKPHPDAKAEILSGSQQDSLPSPR